MQAMSLIGKLKEAAACETCRRYRQGALMVAALLLASWYWS